MCCQREEIQRIYPICAFPDINNWSKHELFCVLSKQGFELERPAQMSARYGCEKDAKMREGF